MVKAVVSLNLCFNTYNYWRLSLGKKWCLCWPGGAPASCPSFFSGIVVVPLMSCCLPVLILFFQGQGMLPYFANFRLLAEFSTPCVNQRYVLACLWPVFQVSLGLFFFINLPWSLASGMHLRWQPQLRISYLFYFCIFLQPILRIIIWMTVCV